MVCNFKVIIIKDDFFIDCVDFEYCMNMRKHGYSLIRNNEIILHHELGNYVKKRIFGKEFVGNNGYKCCIIYKDKIIPLQSYFLFKDFYIEDKLAEKYNLPNSPTLVQVKAAVSRVKVAQHIAEGLENEKSAEPAKKQGKQRAPKVYE